MALNAIKMVFDGSFLTLWCDSKNPNQPTFPEIISLFFTVLLVSTLIATDPLRLPRLRDNERRQRRGEILNKEEEQHKVELVEKYRSEVARRSFPGQYLGSEEAKPKMDRERKQKLGFSEVAMIGCGSMGGGLALLFAESGINVSLSDPSEETMDDIIKKTQKAGYYDRARKHKDYEELCFSLSEPRLLVFSLPHGSVGDTVLDGLMPHLSRNDIILDCGNEHWENTERRQRKAGPHGIRYIGCGVSGGYQAARAGPSMCPGGDESTLKELMPLLETVAAIDKEGRACVGYIGKGGAGHYVKMMHNAIEHGMMSALCEAWGMLRNLGLSYTEIGNIFHEWNGSGELKGTFLVSIGADLSFKTLPSTNEPVISTILDKVVQDVTGEEGTGIWGNTEAIETHVPAPTLNTAHTLRLASAYRGDRERANAVTNGGFPPQKLNPGDRDQFIEDLRKATYAAFLASYIQGLNVIARANQQHNWEINFANIWQIWRAGCIIQADYISDEILRPVLPKFNSTTPANPSDLNLLFNPRAMSDIQKAFPALRRVIAAAVETDQVVPALSSTLEYFKIATNTELPTSFYEAELDYFGKHMFDVKGEEGVEGPTEGRHHFEWKAARSRVEVYGEGKVGSKGSKI